MIVILQQYTKVLKNSNNKFRLQYEYNLCEEGQNMIMKNYSFQKYVIAPPHVITCCTNGMITQNKYIICCQIYENNDIVDVKRPIVCEVNLN